MAESQAYAQTFASNELTSSRQLSGRSRQKLKASEAAENVQYCHRLGGLVGATSPHSGLHEGMLLGLYFGDCCPSSSPLTRDLRVTEVEKAMHTEHCMQISDKPRFNRVYAC